MATTLIDNFSYRGRQYLDSRQRAATLRALRGMPESGIPDGFKAFCEETGHWYEYRRVNTADPETGKWRRDLSETAQETGRRKDIAMSQAATTAAIAALESELRAEITGKPVITDVWRGHFDSGADYYAGDENPATGVKERSITEWHGCLWACLTTGTRQPPEWDGADWVFYMGDDSFRVSLKGGPAAVNPRKFRFTLRVEGRRYNQDVTGHIEDGDVEWTRHSEDRKGNTRTASDTIWGARRGKSGKSLTLTEADLDSGAGVPPVCVFTATVTLRDGSASEAMFRI